MFREAFASLQQSPPINGGQLFAESLQPFVTLDEQQFRVSHSIQFQQAIAELALRNGETPVIARAERADPQALARKRLRGS